jgi:RNA polymerase sigma-70 factor (ECF subfamily)
MQTTSLSLLERLRRPSEAEAWSRFVRLYTPLLYSWAYRFGLTEADAADLVQEVLTLLVQKLPDFAYDPQQRFRGWLWTVTLNQLRAARRRKSLPVEGAERLDDLPAEDAIARFDDAEYARYLIGRALQLLRTDLQPQTWQAFWECTTEGRPAAEVARRLGLSVEAVYAAKSRVLRRLRQELDGLLD